MRIDLLAPALAHLRPLRLCEGRSLFELRAFDLRGEGRLALAAGRAQTAAGRAARAGAGRARRISRGARARSAGGATAARGRRPLAFGAQQLEGNGMEFLALRNDREFQPAALRINDQIFDLAELLAVLAFDLRADDLLADAQRLLTAHSIA